MILYHGSNVIVEKPEVNAGRRALDFGVGFYLTSNREQATRWAQVVTRRRQNGAAILSCFEFDDSKVDGLAIRRFDAPDSAWLDFVVANRRGLGDSQGFDVIIGPVANDSTMPVIDDYMDGRYTKEEAIARLLPQKFTDQFAFVSEKSLMALFFRGSEVIS
jgi:hypothetical protein